MNTLHNSYTHCQAAGRCNELLKLIVNLVIFKTNIKENKFQPYDSWVNFIEGNEVLDNLEETVSEIEFDEE